jgi:hypothetical protein
MLYTYDRGIVATFNKVNASKATFRLTAPTPLVRLNMGYQ